MFEKSLISRLPIRCPEHPKNIITHICTDLKCDCWSLFCEQCRNTYRFKQKHYGHQMNIKQLGSGIQQLCIKMQKDKKVVGNIYRQIIVVKGVEGLLKWQQEKEQHFTSIEKHINTIKFQIEEQLANIIKTMENQLHNQKLRLYNDLQHYYKVYRQKFDKFSKLTEPIVSMNNKFKFYSNPNTITFKIISEAGLPKLSSWLSDLKRTLYITEKATGAPNDYAEQIRKYGQTANDMMDQLPRIRNMQYQKQLPLIVKSSIKQILKSFVKFKEAKSQVLRSTSVDFIPHQSNKWRNSATNIKQSYN